MKSLFFFFFLYFHLGSTNLQQNNCTGGLDENLENTDNQGGGRDHFYKIYSIVSESRKTIFLNKTQSRTVDNCILCSLPKHAPEHDHKKQSHNYNGLLINCRSATNKTECIQIEIAEANVALCALTETWIKEHDDITPLQLCISRYKMHINTKESEIRRWTCTHLLRQYQLQNRERIFL